jgi:hypothetical protein
MLTITSSASSSGILQELARAQCNRLGIAGLLQQGPSLRRGFQLEFQGGSSVLED